jgi:catechol 2,3-dioxygenase-like lactoylglutathione lyase family enzyme
VSDLERSFAFYTTVLGLKPRARWARGAYLTAGRDWVCLSQDDRARSAPHPDYTHLALAVEAASFQACAAAVRAHGAVVWKENDSEGESLYFLDPDGHKLEMHAGDLESRLASLKAQPVDGLQLFD